jgi:cyclopropane fatty-acyl-phospholipid synthase-like methyltransferase
MNFLRRLTFSLWYLHRPPWESGIVPPEVVDFIAATEPGRALDLGCGTGTSSLALTSAGWQVTGVDFVPRAIAIAKRKARIANLTVDFRVANVARLPSFLFTSPFSLVLDIGCFHGLSPSDCSDYLDQLDQLLSPGGTWLLYGFFKPTESPIDNARKNLELIKRQDGTDKNGRPSAWFWVRKIDDRR